MELITRKDPVRKRSKSEEPRKRANSFDFHVVQVNQRIKVCRRAFSFLYVIKNKALYCLTSLVAEGKSPCDGWDKHLHRSTAKSAEICSAIDEHIRDFPLHESHYSTTKIQYLSADLDIKTLHELFCAIHPELALQVKYDFFRNFYNQTHGYRFGRPQIDVCSTCENLETQIKSPDFNDNAKRAVVAEKMVHVRRANKFYAKQREVLTLCTEKEEIGGIVFDYMQNLP